MSSDTYTLINGVEQVNRVSGYRIKYKYGTTTNIDNFLEYKSTQSSQSSQSIYFNNPLIFALFKSHFANEGGNSNIDAISQIKTSSENIVIKCNFGSGAKTEDVSFGFVEPTVDDNPPANVIFLHSSLFNQVDNDEVKKYALVLLERYYNDNNNSNNREKIKTLCKEVKQSGGNPIKDSTRSRTLTRKRKRKIPKK